MKTLNQIAENIAFKLGDQFNTTLQESIKETLIDYRAKLIRDDSDRNFTTELHFSQVGTIQFEVVNLLEEFGADFTCINIICPNVVNQNKYKILKSKKPVPSPVRTKIANRAPYSFIGSLDGSKAFVYTTIDKFPYVKTLPYTQKVVYYVVMNSYIYIINNLNQCDINETLQICNALIKGIFEDPRELYNICELGDKFPDDMPFPIGADMLVGISNAIVKGEYPLKPKDGKEINLKPDVNDNA